MIVFKCSRCGAVVYRYECSRGNYGCWNIAEFTSQAPGCPKCLKVFSKPVKVVVK